MRKCGLVTLDCVGLRYPGTWAILIASKAAHIDCLIVIQLKEEPRTRGGPALGSEVFDMRGVASMVVSEQRVLPDRRALSWRSIAHGCWRPRRRQARRPYDDGRTYIDWHRPHLLFVSVGILLLCSADAALTLKLLSLGAREVNPLMEKLVATDIQAFVSTKMSLTGIGLVLLVALANLRLWRFMRVGQALYVVLAGYLILVGYEVLLLHIAPY